MRAGCTSSPPATFTIRIRIASVARNASGNRRAGGSRCRRACARSTARACVWFAFGSSETTKRASDADALGAHRVALVRHRRRADLLALERLLDLAERLQQAHVARELRRARGDAGDDAEHLRVELARVGLAGDGERRARSPSRAVTRASSSRTFAWSPSKSSRKVACVPVVPFTPRKGSVATRWSRSARSSTRSCIQSVARLPTVVSCAGWKCV